MTVTVHLFARARDLAGAPIIQVELPESATIADLRRRLVELHPPLAGLLSHSAVAVHEEFAPDHTPLSANAEVALLPPVSGG